jgi:ABC-2 type transport system ATP-binding protein
MMINVTDLTFSYPGKGAKVFSGLNISMEGNAVYGLLGKNGMGKSTLLYLICGLLRPKKGSVKVDGMESKERKLQMLEQMFIVTEDFELPQMKLYEYVETNSVFYPNFSMDVLNKCLKEFEMVGDPQLNALSMGQKKKVYMSFALATGTKYLIMDEPTNGLDIPSKAQFRKVLAQGIEGERTIIISTHQVHDVENLLDHVIILDHSEVKMSASVSDICSKYVFEYRSPDDMADALYAEPSLQGKAVMAPRDGKPETTLNLELLFNAVTQGKINL